MRNMIPNRKEKGFTLIELVMVIVILGILAAFALPRFADFSGDAADASVAGARGSVKSAVGIARAKALAENKATLSTDPNVADDGIKLEGTEIELTFGYIAESSLTDAAQLGDYKLEGATPPLSITISEPQANSPCFTYTAATATDAAKVSGLGKWSVGEPGLCTPPS